MVHACDRVQTDGTVLFNGVDNGAEGADKHFVHLSQAADCCKTERSKQNKHLVCNEDDGDDDGDDDGVDDSVDDGVDNGVDDDAEGADKHLVHLSQAADCCKTGRSNVDDCDDDGDDDGADSADKHLAHLFQTADC
eukprot:1041742-Ditylum_brightwellii.AAC.1